jgi:hypothetical protein
LPATQPHHAAGCCLALSQLLLLHAAPHGSSHYAACPSRC